MAPQIDHDLVTHDVAERRCARRVNGHLPEGFFDINTAYENLQLNPVKLPQVKHTR